MTLNLRALSETVATLNQYVQYLFERAAAQGLNESQLNVSLLLDHFAAELRAAEGFAAWATQHGPARRKGQPVESAVNGETAPTSAEDPRRAGQASAELGSLGG